MQESATPDQATEPTHLELTRPKVTNEAKQEKISSPTNPQSLLQNPLLMNLLKHRKKCNPNGNLQQRKIGMLQRVATLN